jgi:hypothetical protein
VGGEARSGGQVECGGREGVRVRGRDSEGRLCVLQPRVGVYASADGARRGLARIREGRLLEHLPLARHVHVSLAACADAVY